MENWFTNPTNYYGMIAGIGLLVLWSSVWKAIALWKAARNDATVWFIIFLILNTAGILEIIYIFVVSKKNSNPQS